MKLKLLTIGILALFLLSILPAAATAAPKAQTVSESLYTVDLTAVQKGPQVGTMKLDTTTGQFSASAKGLTPGTKYIPCVFWLVSTGPGTREATARYLSIPQGGTTPTVYTVDANGHLTIRLTLSQDTLTDVKQDYLPYTHNFGITAPP